MSQRTCANCGASIPPRRVRRGMCGACYQRAQKYGSPGEAPLRGIELFWSKVDRADDDSCWQWTGTIGPDGYGRFGAPGALHGTNSAHRIAYTDTCGVIPAGLVLDHLCRNRSCVNPRHLEPVTQRTNILRGEGVAAINAAKETCSQGHQFDYMRSDDRRGCKTCEREWDQRKYLRKKQRQCA